MRSPKAVTRNSRSVSARVSDAGPPPRISAPPGAASKRRGGNAQPAELRVAGCEKIHSEKPTAARGFSRSRITADQRTPRSKSTRRLIVAVQAKRSPGIGGRLAQGSGERQRRGTKGRHCPEPVRPKALDNRPAGKRKQSGRNTDADGTVDGQCRRLEEAKFAADSPLKGAGLEPSVPPFEASVPGLASSFPGVRHCRWPEGLKFPG